MVTAEKLTDAEILHAVTLLNQPYPAGFTYFLRNYVYIEDRKFLYGVLDPLRSTIKWEWWPVHHQLMADMASRLLIILKARQISVSWFLAAYRLHNALFNRNYLYMIISQGEREAQEALRKSHFIYDHLPWWLQPGLETDNASEMVLAGMHSSLQALPSTERAGRSYTANCIEADEAAHHVYAAQNFAAYSPAIDAGGQHIIVSTANGYGNFFEKMYHNAKKGLSPYQWRFYPWNVRPGRDRDWLTERAQALIAAGEGGTLRQEYPETDEEAFLVTGRPRFSAEAILSGLANSKDGLEIPQELRHIPGLTIWKLPVAGQPYVMFSDPAEGLPQGDWSVTQVLQARNLEHVATIKGHFEPAYFSQITAEIGIRYNTALWGWERNNHGHVMTEVADKQLRYPRMYFHQEREATLHQRSEGLRPPERLGFPTNSLTRPLLVDGLTAVLDTHNLTSYSQSFWEECRTFIIDDKGTARGATGATDDEVIAMGGAVYLCAQPGAQSMRGPSQEPRRTTMPVRL